jgi:hypothetical protein
MQANTFCFLRLFTGLLAFVVAGGAHGEGMRIVAQHIETLGARQWLGVAAASFVATAPVIAPVSQRLAAAWSRNAARRAEPSDRRVFHVLTDNFV